MRRMDNPKVNRMVVYVKRQLRTLELLYQKRDFEGISCLFGEQAVLVRTGGKRVYTGGREIARFWQDASKRGITKVRCEVLRSAAVPADFLLAERNQDGEKVYAPYDFVLHVFGVCHFIESTERNSNGDFLLLAGHRIVCRGELLGMSIDS